MKQMDYYGILQLEAASASHEDIARQFRKLAIEYHPLKQKKDIAKNTIKFSQVCEAYEVLSRADLKAIYDRNGMAGLKNGVNTEQKGDKTKTTGVYCFSGNSFDIFEKVFGTKNPFAETFVDPATVELVPKRETPSEDEPEDIVIPLDCSIFEFYNGSIKTFSYHRDELQPDGRSLLKLEEEMVIEVKPGFDTDTVLSYPSKGNEAPACKQSPLKVVFRLNNEGVGEVNYKRKGNDLYYTHNLSLEDALVSKPFSIRTLDGRTINLNLDEVITPQTTHVVPNEGMPILGKDGQKGTLYVKFNIIFPEKLNVAYRQEIISILTAHQEEAQRHGTGY